MTVKFNETPYIVHDWPIKDWKGMFPTRSDTMEVRVSLDFSCSADDAEKLGILVAAVNSILIDAVFKDSGNPVTTSKLAIIEAEDGRKSMVPASSIPPEILRGRAEKTNPNSQAATVGQKYLGEKSLSSDSESVCNHDVSDDSGTLC